MPPSVFHPEKNVDKHCNICSPLNLNFANNFCQTRQIIAQKVIRLCGMKSVFKLIARIPDLYLIATFRDPRGIFQSINRLYKGSLTYDWVRT